MRKGGYAGLSKEIIKTMMTGVLAGGRLPTVYNTISCKIKWPKNLILQQLQIVVRLSRQLLQSMRSSNSCKYSSVTAAPHSEHK